MDALADGDVVLLENLRFNAGETAKDDAERGAFARQLAQFADLFVSDGFGVVHRKQASVFDVARLVPAYAGGLVAAEVEVSRRLLEDPARPYAVVLGGSKVSDKLGVIDSLLDRADLLAIGGGMVFTFLKAQGHAIGASLVEEDQLDTVRGYLAKAAEKGVEILLPQDIVMAASFDRDADHWTVEVDALESTPGRQRPALGLDIGPRAAAAYAERIRSAQTVFWNGPMGVFEFPAFAAGTKAVAEVLTSAHGGRADGRLTVVGGGDSAAAVRALGFADVDFGTHLDRRGRLARIPRGTHPPPASTSWRDDSWHMAKTPAQAQAQRTPLIAGNWKMNLDHFEALTLVQKLAWALRDAKVDLSAIDVDAAAPLHGHPLRPDSGAGREDGSGLRLPGPLTA